MPTPGSSGRFSRPPARTGGATTSSPANYAQPSDSPGPARMLRRLAMGGLFEDVEDDFGLGVGVCQSVIRPQRGGAALGPGVSIARFGVRAQVVAKTQVLGLPLRTLLADVHVNLARAP